jgi:porphobilinogen synthase
MARAGVEDIPISSMPGVNRLGWQTGLLREVAEARAAGVNSVVIFPKTPDHLKTSTAEEAFNPDGLAQRTFRLLKSKCAPCFTPTLSYLHCVIFR